SKYQRRSTSVQAPVEPAQLSNDSEVVFPEDEPFFARPSEAVAAEPFHELPLDTQVVDAPVEVQDEESTWEQEEQTEPAARAVPEARTFADEISRSFTEEPDHVERDSVHREPTLNLEPPSAAAESAIFGALPGTVEEEEIEEEEADIASYVEELEE